MEYRMETKRVEVNGDVDSLLVMSDLHSFIEPLEILDGIIASWPGSVQVVVAGDILSGGEPCRDPGMGSHECR